MRRYNNIKLRKSYQDVLLQVAFLDERLVTIVALVRPDVVVELLVVPQVSALLQFGNKPKH